MDRNGSASRQGSGRGTARTRSATGRTPSGWSQVLWGVFCVGALAACDADEAKERPSSEPLRQVDIPSDFTFAMSRGLELQVSADAALAPFAPLAVQVSLPTGEALFRGPIEAGATRTIEVLSPLATRELQVKLTGRSKTVEATASFVGSRAQVELR